MAYPSSIGTFSGTTAQGTSVQSSPDHALDHRNLGSAVGTIEQVIGTTSGTAILMNFTAGKFAARTVGETHGTSTWIGGTIGTAVIGTSTIQGGTIASAVLSSPTSPSGSALSGALQQMVNNSTLVNGSAPGTAPVVMVAGTFTTTQSANVFAAVTGSWYNLAIAQNIGTLFFNGTAITPVNGITDDFAGASQGRGFSGAGEVSAFSGIGTVSMQHSGGGSGTSVAYGASINVLVFNA